MQLYLCEKYDKDHKISFPYDSDEYWETVEWLVWMVRSVWRRYPLFVPNKTFELPQMVPPTNPILLKHSKAASDLCRGSLTIFLAVSIAVIHECLWFWFWTGELTFPSADAPEKIPYAINRYQTETKRLYQVLNDRLASERKINKIPEGEAAYLVGNKYTLSDICVFSWGKSNSSPSMLAERCVAS
jgi:hypothetical protein